MLFEQANVQIFNVVAVAAHTPLILAACLKR